MNKYSAKIKITLRKGILDVQGKAVENALHQIGYEQIENVRIGKFVELDITSDNHSLAYSYIDEACKKLIANPIIEDYQIELIEC